MVSKAPSIVTFYSSFPIPFHYLSFKGGHEAAFLVCVKHRGKKMVTVLASFGRLSSSGFLNLASPQH